MVHAGKGKRHKCLSAQGTALPYPYQAAATKLPKGFPLIFCAGNELTKCATITTSTSSVQVGLLFYRKFIKGEHRTCEDHPAKRDLEGTELDAECEPSGGAPTFLCATLTPFYKSGTLEKPR